MFKGTGLHAGAQLEYLVLHAGEQIHAGGHFAVKQLLDPEILLPDPVLPLRLLLCHLLEQVDQPHIKIHHTLIRIFKVLLLHPLCQDTGIRTFTQ